MRLDLEITIQHSDGCPNLERAEERVREALREINGEASIQRKLIATQEDALRLSFVGSPTILVDGRDPFGQAGTSPALACRIYQTEDGPDGAPSVQQLSMVLKGASPRGESKAGDE